MGKNKGKVFLNTVIWGLILWLIGYALGMIFFFFVPKDQIGWYILPIGTIITLWILFKKIERESFGCYFGVGIIWMIMALLLDYIFIVKLLKSPGYYKLDVYVYYVLTLILPILIGWYKVKNNKLTKQNA